MAKQKTKGQKRAEAELKKDPKRAHIRAGLLSVHKFLREDFRQLKKDELESKEVFSELFGAKAKFEPYKLKAIYAFQN